jgi:hypothetical protein
MSYKRDYSQGKEDAQRDLAHGEQIVKTAGKQASWAGWWNRILQEKYGVKLVWGVGCTGSEDEFDYVRGYNEIARQVIREKFGNDIVEATNEEARQAYEMEFSDLNSKPAMESKVDSFGIVDCAYCGGHFNVCETEQWDGQIHKQCGYPLRLYKVDLESTI